MVIVLVCLLGLSCDVAMKWVAMRVLNVVFLEIQIDLNQNIPLKIACSQNGAYMIYTVPQLNICTLLASITRNVYRTNKRIMP